jgi:predicted ATPase
MIKEIKINGYKALNFEEKIKLNNFTILSGINNSGKTSFIKSILDLFLYSDNSSNHNSAQYDPIFANYKTKVFEHKTDNTMEFMYILDIDKMIAELKIVFAYDKESNGGFISYWNLELLDSGNRELLKSLTLHKENKDEYYDIKAYKILTPLYVKIQDEIEVPDEFNGKGDALFLGYIPFKVICPMEENKELNDIFELDLEKDTEIEFMIGKSSRDLHQVFSKISYIGPLRSTPEEYYYINHEINRIDSTGKNTIEFLNAKKKINVSFYKTVASTKTITMSLEKAVQFWFNYFFENKAKLEIKPLSENLLQVFINGHTINNSGFGFSQLMPIIVKGLLLEENELFLLEQPEIHLHPALEMKLATFLLCIAKNNRQIIAETHSEHIINALILEKMDNIEMEKLFKIYFCRRDEEETIFEDIIIDERGNIVNWPEGFFDQYLNFTKTLIEKRKKIADLRKNA